MLHLWRILSTQRGLHPGGVSHRTAQDLRALAREACKNVNKSVGKNFSLLSAWYTKTKWECIPEFGYMMENWRVLTGQKVNKPILKIIISCIVAQYFRKKYTTSFPLN